MSFVKRIDREVSKYDVVYVSPHLDDVAYSCCAQVRRHVNAGEKVLVISVFTAHPSILDGDIDDTKTIPGTPLSSPGRSPSRPLGVDAGLRAFLNMERRYEEDRMAMRKLGCDYHYMNLPEMLIRREMKKSASCFDEPKTCFLI